MKPWKKYLFYLVLNVIVAAATTLLVLTLWDRSHRAQLPAAPPPPAAVAQNAAQVTPQPVGPAATLPPLDQPVIEIKNVFGAGDLQNEVVVIQRIGEGELALARWKLQDENGNEYTFPDLVLNKDGAVQVYTRDGQDTVIELFWKRSAPAWTTGEQVSILDPDGNSRATFIIP